MRERVITDRSRADSVLEVVGLPTTSGVTWVWAHTDLDMGTVTRARIDLAALFVGDCAPQFVLVYLGAECFVDVRGLRLLVETARKVRDGSGSLTVVAPPHCLRRMIELVGLEDELPAVPTARHAVSLVRRQARG